MRSFRRRRRRIAALALLPATALIASAGMSAASGATSEGSDLDANKRRVTFKEPVTFRGQFEERSNGAVAVAGQSGAESEPETVDLQFSRAGLDSWRTVRRDVRVGEHGWWDTRLLVRKSGHFRAIHDDGRRSELRKVRVKSRTRARKSTRNLTRGERLKVRGKVKPGGRRKVIVKIGGEKIRTRTNRRGKFKVRWRADGTGTRRIKVIATGNRVAARSKDRVGKVTVYRPATASWYGPGLYGNRTACGQTLTRGTVGVAHKSMPCGTKLKLRHRGNTVKVRVIDRGPYVHGREFDLTEETRNRLGFGSTGTVYSSK